MYGFLCWTGTATVWFVEGPICDIVFIHQRAIRWWIAVQTCLTVRSHFNHRINKDPLTAFWGLRPLNSHHITEVLMRATTCSGTGRRRWRACRSSPETRPLHRFKSGSVRRTARWKAGLKTERVLWAYVEVGSERPAAASCRFTLRTGCSSPVITLHFCRFPLLSTSAMPQFPRGDY